MLMAGDAYFHHREMDARNPWCTPGLRLYQTMMEKDRAARLHNQRRLRSLRERFGAEITLLSAHYPVEFERAASRDVNTPVARGSKADKFTWAAWPHRREEHS
jgi:hypothetical protein